MTTTGKWLGIIAALTSGLLFSSTGFTGSLYRCGSTYQDRPCAHAEPSKTLAGGMNSAATSSTAADAGCARRGEEAKKIVWAREAGAVLDQQLTKARNANERQLINEVYGRRGTSSDVSAAIAADCVAAKEKTAQAAALLEASRGGQAAPSEPGKASPQNNSQENSSNAADANPAKKSSAREVAQRKIRCDHMQSQIDNVTSQQRAGGSARTMDDLNQTRRNIESRMSADSCA